MEHYPLPGEGGGGGYSHTSSPFPPRFLLNKITILHVYPSTTFSLMEGAPDNACRNRSLFWPFNFDTYQPKIDFDTYQPKIDRCHYSYMCTPCMVRYNYCLNRNAFLLSPCRPPLKSLCLRLIRSLHTHTLGPI